nr:hypothetical protein [Providencia sp. PROV201]
MGRRFTAATSVEARVKGPVSVRDAETGKIMGPYPLVTRGKGYACVSTEKGPRWIPAKNVRPFREPLPQAADSDTDATE